MDTDLKEFSRGAEAILYRTKNQTLIKKRDKKEYRHKLLDEKIRKFRTKREYKILQKLYENKVNVPKPIKIDLKKKIIEFEEIKGNIIKDHLTEEKVKKIFNQIIQIHKNGIIHSDLTTLNMIEKGDEIYIIDFGLSEFSTEAEKRGIDLNLFFNCLDNQHPEIKYNKEELLKSYSEEIENAERVIEKIEIIKRRGRNKNKKSN